MLGPIISATGSRKVRSVSAVINRKDMDLISGLLSSGKVVPVIDRCFRLGEIGEAFRYYEDGLARGKVVITMDTQSAPTGIRHH